MRGLNMLELLTKIKQEYEEFRQDNTEIELIEKASEETTDFVKAYKNSGVALFTFYSIFNLLLYLNKQNHNDIIKVEKEFANSFDNLQKKGLLGNFLQQIFNYDDKELEKIIDLSKKIEEICLSPKDKYNKNPDIYYDTPENTKELELFIKIEILIRILHDLPIKKSPIKSTKKFTNLKDYMLINQLTYADLEQAFLALTTFNNSENIKYMYNLLRKNLDRETIDFVISLEKQVDSRDDIVTIVYDTKKDPFNIKYLISLNNRAVSYKQKLEKSKGKITNLYLKLMKQISTWNEEKYIELKDIQFNFLSAELKQELLLAIHNHNKNIFEKIYNENLEYENNKFLQLEHILIKNNIDVSFSNEFKENFSEESLEILQLIINNNWDFCFKNNTILEDILTNTNLTKINVVNKTFQEFNIPLSFLENNYEILTSKYSLFLRNITFIKNENIQLKDYAIILSDSKKLLAFYDLACAYNLNLRKTKNNNNKFLTTIESYNFLDNYIELGLSEFIKTHLEFCQSKNENILKRVIIAQDLEILEESYFKEIVRGKNFFIPNECLDEVIINDENIVNNEKYHNVLVQDNLDYTENIYTQKLDEKYQISKYEYDFEGIIISRIKVIRNLNALIKNYPNDDINELIFNAIIYNTYLSLDKLDTIHNLLYGYSLKATL